MKLLALFAGILAVALGHPGHSSHMYFDGETEVLAPKAGRPLSAKEFYLASKMTSESPDAEEDPIELAGLYEGDIVMTEEDYELHFNNSERNAIKRENLKWPQGVVPYTIATDFTANERMVIAKAIAEYHERTCIKFRPRSNERDYVSIVKGRGCSSRVGRTGGSQAVTLGNGCVYNGIVIHELMHAIGFWHEQSRADRDDYVIIHWDNIQKGMEFNFQKYGWDMIQSLGVSYDTYSVMHYGPYAFASNPKLPTISPRRANHRMGQRNGFSDKDLIKINKLYKCEGVPTPAPSSPDACADDHKHCKAWAKRGECEKNPRWMLLNCRLSCKMCEEMSTPSNLEQCDDTEANCAALAEAGKCTYNADEMAVKCPKSCGICGVAEADEDN